MEKFGFEPWLQKQYLMTFQVLNDYLDPSSLEGFLTRGIMDPSFSVCPKCIHTLLGMPSTHLKTGRHQYFNVCKAILRKDLFT